MQIRETSCKKRISAVWGMKSNFKCKGLWGIRECVGRLFHCCSEQNQFDDKVYPGRPGRPQADGNLRVICELLFGFLPFLEAIFVQNDVTNANPCVDTFRWHFHILASLFSCRNVLRSSWKLEATYVILLPGNSPNLPRIIIKLGGIIYLRTNAIMDRRFLRLFMERLCVLPTPFFQAMIGNSIPL